MTRPRRRLRRSTWRARRRWHRMVRPLRRPTRMVVVAAMLAVVVLGVFVGLALPDRTYSEGDTFRVEPDSTVVLEVEPRGDLRVAGLEDGDRLLSLDGVAARDVADSLTHQAYPFYGFVGDTTHVEVERDGERLVVPMVYGAQDASDARRIGLSSRALSRLTSVLGYLGLVAFAIAGLILVIRSRGRGYLASLGVALIAVAGGGAVTPMMQSDIPLPGAVAAFAIGLGVIMFFSALPAVTAALVRFPDGSYTPRWTRWTRALTIVGVVVWLAATIAMFESGRTEAYEAVSNGLILLLLAVPAIGLAQKYRRSGDAVVRQKMKWVLLPLGVFIAVFAVSSLAPELFRVLDNSRSVTGYAFSVLAGVLTALSLAVIPLGVLAGVLNFRPWDADQWIARSVAVGAATLGLAAVFAGGAEALRVGLRSSMGDGAEAVAAALAAVVALVVFNPVREWLTRRADADLIRTKEKLTERLPLLLAGRQVVGSPQEVGRVALAAVRDALQTDRAAVVDLDPDGWEVVATDGLTADAVLEWADATLDPTSMPTASAQVWEDPTFVLRVPLWSVEDELVGVLALGTHGKGRGYSTEERKALDAASRSLAEALRVAERREEAEARQFARFSSLVDRLKAAGNGAPSVDLEVG